ncbi:hypothetical protein GGD64_000016 [Bradyrhizobium sp. CIR3A]|nr:hypothetical protein [Bradyrhizobium sp. CIR3A]MBB4392475.1 hypothetical protein [Bradyrhizobium sp. ERR14]NYG48190.1 hypothetical protein [Bradyrhizobium sp. IAR9]
MKEPEWYEVLEPREAVLAGVIGFAVVCPLVYYASHVEYVLWGYSPREWKNLGTALVVLSFAVPYVLMRWGVRR